MTTTADPVADTTPARDRRTRDRTLGLSGIAFTVVLLAVVVVPHASLDYPVTEPPAGHVITSFFRAHRALEEYQTLMHSLAAVLLVVFLAALAQHVRRAGAPLAALLTLAGGVGIATVMLVTMALVGAAVALAGGVDGQVLGWVYQLGWWAHFRGVVLLPLALVPACHVLRAARVLPAALAWPAIVLGVLGPVAVVGALAASTEFLVYPVFFLLMIWVLATGIVAVTRGLGRVSG